MTQIFLMNDDLNLVFLYHIACILAFTVTTAQQLLNLINIALYYGM